MDLTLNHSLLQNHFSKSFQNFVIYSLQPIESLRDNNNKRTSRVVDITRLNFTKTQTQKV